MKTQYSIGTTLISRSLFRRINNVSRSNRACISPFCVLVVEHIFEDSEEPRKILVNFKGVLGAYEVTKFKRPGWFELCLCFPLQKLRFLREKLWDEINRLRRMAMQ